MRKNQFFILLCLLHNKSIGFATIRTEAIIDAEQKCHHIGRLVAALFFEIARDVERTFAIRTRIDEGTRALARQRPPEGLVNRAGTGFARRQLIDHDCARLVLAYFLRSSEKFRL